MRRFKDRLAGALVAVFVFCGITWFTLAERYSRYAVSSLEKKYGTDQFNALAPHSIQIKAFTMMCRAGEMCFAIAMRIAQDRQPTQEPPR